jgi:hypothetical protein
MFYVLIYIRSVSTQIRQNRGIMVRGKRSFFVFMVMTCLILMIFAVDGYSQDKPDSLQAPSGQQTPTVQQPSVSIKKEWLGLVVTTELSASPLTFAGTCPATFTIKGVIYANRATAVQYKFIRSDNAEIKPVTLTFEKEGKKEITYTWQIGDAVSRPEFDEWIAMDAVFPVNRKIRSNAVFIKGSCTGK